MFGQWTGSAAGGYQPQNVDIIVTNREGANFALGDIVTLDLEDSAAETTVTTPGGAEGTTRFNNIIDPTVLSIQGGISGVCLEAIANDATGKIRLFGLVDAFVIMATGNIVLGDLLVATTANNLDAIGVATERPIAIAQTAHTAPTARIISSVLFNGITGWGPAVA